MSNIITYQPKHVFAGTYLLSDETNAVKALLTIQIDLVTETNWFELTEQSNACHVWSTPAELKHIRDPIEAFEQAIGSYLYAAKSMGSTCTCTCIMPPLGYVMPDPNTLAFMSSPPLNEHVTWQ